MRCVLYIFKIAATKLAACVQETCRGREDSIDAPPHAELLMRCIWMQIMQRVCALSRARLPTPQLLRR